MYPQKLLAASGETAQEQATASKMNTGFIIDVARVCVSPMSEASDSRELTVLVFMTRSLAGTVAATKTSGQYFTLQFQTSVQVAMYLARLRRLQKSAVHQHAGGA